MIWTWLKGSFITEPVRPHSTAAVAMHIKQTHTHTQHTQTLCLSSIMPPQTALYLRITLAHNCSERVLHYSGSFWCRRVSCALQRWSDLIRLHRRSQSLECQLIRWLRQMRTNRAQRSPTRKKHKTNIQVQDNKCVCLKQVKTQTAVSAKLFTAGGSYGVSFHTQNTNMYNLWGFFIGKVMEDKTPIHCWITVGFLMKS